MMGTPYTDWDHLSVTRDLHEMWKRTHVLCEAAKGPDDLPQGVYVALESSGKYLTVFFSDTSGAEMDHPKKREGLPPLRWGRIELEPTKQPGCEGAWEVFRSHAVKGWGPLLYDVAMEWASENGGGLVTDRSQVSSKAQGVWVHYFKNRGDVKKHRLPDDCAYTPETDPEFNPAPAENDEAAEALAHRYTKAPVTIQKLRLMGKLIEN